MGGASRNDKRNRQEAANRRLAAAGIKVPPKKQVNLVPLIVVAVVIGAAVVVGLALWFTRAAREPVTRAYTATATAGVVTAGSGPVVVDIYADYLCPACERFEESYGDEITTALNEGKITVRYHHVAILDDRSTPEGYSTRAANAALCAAPAGIFPAYHAKLFDTQPTEGNAGLTDTELIALGGEVGAPADFAGCVQGATNAAAVKAETDAAKSDPALLSNGQFGTPTVAIKGAKIDLNDSAWLSDAIAAG